MLARKLMLSKKPAFPEEWDTGGIINVFIDCLFMVLYLASNVYRLMGDAAGGLCDEYFRLTHLAGFSRANGVDISASAEVSRPHRAT